MSDHVKMGLAAVLAGALGFVGGAAREAAAAPQQKYEYWVKLLTFEEFKELEAYKGFEKELKSPWKAQFAFQEVDLTAQGAQGWELVQVVVPKAPSETIFYLRRPLN